MLTSRVEMMNRVEWRIGGVCYDAFRHFNWRLTWTLSSWCAKDRNTSWSLPQIKFRFRISTFWPLLLQLNYSTETFMTHAHALAREPDESANSGFICSGGCFWLPSRSDRFPADVTQEQGQSQLFIQYYFHKQPGRPPLMFHVFRWSDWLRPSIQLRQLSDINMSSSK